MATVVEHQQTSTRKNQRISRFVLADREECKRILKEENVAIMCAYMLMHFIHTKGDPAGIFGEQ